MRSDSESGARRRADGFTHEQGKSTRAERPINACPGQESEDIEQSGTRWKEACYLQCDKQQKYTAAKLHGSSSQLIERASHASAAADYTVRDLANESQAAGHLSLLDFVRT